MMKPVLAVLLALASAGPALAEAVATFEDGRVSLEAVDAPLDDALQAIAAAAGLDAPSLGDTGETFTGRFTALSLADGLRRLLGTRSFILSYAADGRPDRLVLFGGAGAPAAEAAPGGDFDESAMGGDESAMGGDEAGMDDGSDDSAMDDDMTGAAADQERFVAAGLTERDVGARVAAVRGLGSLPPERAMQLARQVVASEREPVVRAELAAALADVPDPGSVVLLQLLVADADEMVRGAAIEALAILGGPEAEAELRQIMERPGDPMAETAAQLLGCAGPDDCPAD